MRNLIKLLPAICLLTFFLMGCATRSQPTIITHKYNYQATPSPAVPGVPPSKPEALPPVEYPTTYPSTPFDDPTLVIFINESERVTFYISIDNKPLIALMPNQATANLHLDVGGHRVRIKGYIPTILGTRQIPERSQTIRIKPQGRPQIIHLYDTKSIIQTK